MRVRGTHIWYEASMSSAKINDILKKIVNRFIQNEFHNISTVTMTIVHKNVLY